MVRYWVPRSSCCAWCCVQAWKQQGEFTCLEIFWIKPRHVLNGSGLRHVFAFASISRPWKAIRCQIACRMLQLYCSISSILTTWLKAALRVVMLLVLLMCSSIRGDIMCACVFFLGGGRGGERVSYFTGANWLSLDRISLRPHGCVFSLKYHLQHIRLF